MKFFSGLVVILKFLFCDLIFKVILKIMPKEWIRKLKALTPCCIEDAREDVTTDTFRFKQEMPSSSAITSRPIHQNGRVMTFQEFFENIDKDPTFLETFINQLARMVNFEAYYFECPPVNIESMVYKPFEFTLTKSESLRGRPADPHAFFEHFKKESRVAIFKNLNGDSTLIAPCPSSRYQDGFPHLAQFMRTASQEDIANIWKVIGEEMRKIGERNVWLSTAGDGISWLHFRLDQAPKYYRHESYKADI